MAERKTAPVILFTYNRPEHTRRTIEALAKNELAQDTELFVFSDAAKKEADRGKVQEIRDYVAQAGGFFKVTLIAREEKLRACQKRDRGCDGDHRALWYRDRSGG